MAACWCPLPSHPWWYSENILSLWTDHPGRQLMVLRFRLPKSIKIDLQDFKIISLDPQSGSENLWLRKLILQLPISELPPFSASYTHFLCAKVTLEIQNCQPLSKYQPWLFQGPLSLFTGSPQAALPGLPLLRVIRVLALQSVFHTISWTSKSQVPLTAVRIPMLLALCLLALAPPRLTDGKRGDSGYDGFCQC